MDPAAWRKRANLSLRDLAVKLGRAWSSLRRWENGERDAPNEIVLAYQRESRGEVTSADFNRVRKRFLRTEGSSSKAA